MPRENCEERADAPIFPKRLFSWSLRREPGGGAPALKKKRNVW
jgi:hypothetical protein